MGTTGEGGVGEKRGGEGGSRLGVEEKKARVAGVEEERNGKEAKGPGAPGIKLLSLGYVPIKGSFLVPLSENSEKSEKEPKAPAGFARSGKSKKQVKREQAEMRRNNASICNALARTGTCRYGDSCKFNHDVEGFLAQKPADLPGDCLFVALTGSCPYGLSCRYYGSHERAAKRSEGDEAPQGAADLKTLGREALLEQRVPLPVPGSIEGEANVLTDDLKIRLRRKEEEYPKSEDILKKMNVKSNKHYARKGKKKGKDNASDFFIEKGDTEVAKSTPRERKKLDFRNKLYLSPLTTVGNLPYRRICKTYGADITCGEMAMATNLLQGKRSEWALLKRHPSEDFFGVQLAGAYPDSVARASELVSRELDVDFIDINMGCPIDLLCNKGAGAALLQRPNKIETLAKCVSPVIDIPLTLKMRKGYYDGKDIVHEFVPKVSSWNVRALTLHGRTREQRYTRTADWDYIEKVAGLAGDLPVIGNGDIFNFEEYNDHVRSGKVSTVMIGRAALIKPWIFSEIKEQRHIDISATERLDMMKVYCTNGLEHWGSDSRGVETTRRYLLEWLSFLHRYVPVGLLEVLPQSMGMRPPAYYGRSDLETLLASSNSSDWIKISEMLLGPTPATFSFVPKHKSYSYKVLSKDERADAGENG